LEASNPAFGAALQGCNVFCREVQIHDLTEKCGSFGWGKPQIGSTQLSQLIPNA
jgi:hypothetical protein